MTTGYYARQEQYFIADANEYIRRMNHSIAISDE